LDRRARTRRGLPGGDCGLGFEGPFVELNLAGTFTLTFHKAAVPVSFFELSKKHSGDDMKLPFMSQEKFGCMMLLRLCDEL
jgi:hypothetical protein